MASLFLLLVFSCKREPDDFLIWQKSPGRGSAFFISSTPDSCVISSGTLNNRAYLTKLSKSKDLKMEFISESDGLFSSVLYNASFIFAAGSSEGNMLISRHAHDGHQDWMKTFDPGFKIDITTLLNTGEGSFLAIGSASADSLYDGTSGLLFVRFNSEGEITLNKQLPESSYIAANNAVMDADGNIYLSLTRKNEASATRASVAKYNSDLNKLWETELYNNVNFGASGRGLLADNNNNILVTGKTEVSKESGILEETYLASLSVNGNINWKKYLENSNCGASLLSDEAGILYLLNKNCFFINMLNSDDGTDSGRIRIFDACDPYTTDAFGMGFATDYDGRILVAGSRGGNYYMALKDPEVR